MSFETPQPPAGAESPEAVLRAVGATSCGVAPTTLEVYRGELTAMVSRPADGAVRLGRMLTGLAPIDGGDVRIGTCSLAALDADEVRRLRLHRIGYVLRDIGLPGDETVAEALHSPFALTGSLVSDDDEAWLSRLAQSLGLLGVLDLPSRELDAGLRQRVGIARALALRPEVVFAEEPTQPLDDRSSRVILAVLRVVAHEYGTAILLATEDERVAEVAERVIAIREGGIVAERRGADTAWIHDELGPGRAA